MIFTDEWGGGTGARCRETDQPEWGANAIFDIVDGQMQFASYYKLPVPQTLQENCVAHNGSLVPVPGRDILVQAWYQGGISMIDFTDSANPVEIALLRSGSDQPDVARPRRVLVGLLVQRQRLRQRDRPRASTCSGCSPARTCPTRRWPRPARCSSPSSTPSTSRRSRGSRASRWLGRGSTSSPARARPRSPGRHNGPLVVSGVTCLDGATVSGPVTVGAGASLALAGLDDRGAAVRRRCERRAPLHHDGARSGLDQRSQRQRRRGGLDRPRPRRRWPTTPRATSSRSSLAARSTGRSPAPGTSRRRSTSVHPTR